jgi:hypothetical protein
VSGGIVFESNHRGNRSYRCGYRLSDGPAHTDPCDYLRQGLIRIVVISYRPDGEKFPSRFLKRRLSEDPAEKSHNDPYHSFGCLILSDVIPYRRCNQPDRVQTASMTTVPRPNDLCPGPDPYSTMLTRGESSPPRSITGPVDEDFGTRPDPGRSPRGVRWDAEPGLIRTVLIRYRHAGLYRSSRSTKRRGADSPPKTGTTVRMKPPIRDGMERTNFAGAATSKHSGRIADPSVVRGAS